MSTQSQINISVQIFSLSEHKYINFDYLLVMKYKHLSTLYPFYLLNNVRGDVFAKHFVTRNG